MMNLVEEIFLSSSEMKKIFVMKTTNLAYKKDLMMSI